MFVTQETGFLDIYNMTKEGGSVRGTFICLLAFTLAALETAFMYSLLLRKVQIWRSEKEVPD